MALWIGDYIANTSHLSTAEHGAYLLLIMHYWATGGLPDDDRQLARVAKMTLDEWREARPTIQAFFIDGWKHRRVEFELTEAARILAQTKAAGKASGLARRAAKQRTETNGRSDVIGQQDQVLAQASPQTHANGTPTERQRLHSPSHIKKDARARAQGSDPSVLKKAKEANGQVRIQIDDPQWEPWQAHLRKTTGRGSPQDKAFGWSFPSLWPPGYVPP
jgi:uncharacterized protein YdaU (DUF1376 family)